MPDQNSALALAAGADTPDEEIVRQVLDGNTAMFELLMRRYNERLYRAARSITRDDREAEDVIQQAYFNAFSSLRQFQGHARFSTWLTRIAINESLARVRRRRRYEPFDEEESKVEPLLPERSAPTPERSRCSRSTCRICGSSTRSRRRSDGAASRSTS